MSSSLAEGFDNPEMAQSMIDQREERQEQEQEERAKAAKDRDAILAAIEEETCHIRLKGKRIKMHVMSGDEEDWIEDIADEYAEYDDENELPAEKRSDYIDGRERIIDILTKKSVSEHYDRTFWKRLRNEYRQEVLGKLRKGGEESARSGN